MKRKLLIFASALISLSAFAQSQVDKVVENNIEYTLYSSEDGSQYAEATGYIKGWFEENFSLPSEIHKDGKIFPLTAIADSAFYNTSNFRSIVIPEHVKSIGCDAFSSSYLLESIVLPESLLSIGDRAFSSTSITKVKIPNSVTTIGESAFRGSSLGSLYLSNSLEYIGEHAFEWCPNLSAIYYNTEKFISADKNVFDKDNYSWALIGGATLYIAPGKRDTAKITEPWRNFGTIVERDFSSNIEVNNLEYAFNTNGNYYEVIGANLSEPTDIVIPNKIEVNGVEYEVKYIDPYAFSGCDNLKSAVIPQDVYLDNGTFAACRNLEGVFLGGFYRSIPDRTFDKCRNLRKFISSTPLDYIGEYAFSECYLNNISLAKDATIKPNAFSLGGIVTLNVDSIPAYPKDLFSEDMYEYTTLNVPFGMLDSAKTTEPWMYFKNINEKDLLDPSAFWDNDLKYRYGNNGWEVSGVYQAHNDIAIPNEMYGNSIKTIGESAFEDCFFIKNISIPESVLSIGNTAFSGCSGLSHIELPNSIKSISNRTFEYCTNLTDIIIPTSVTFIDSGAFQACTSLTSINLPPNITSIEWATFDMCTSLKHIDIPNSVTKIDGWAFISCKNLESINFPDNLISIGESAFSLCDKLGKVTFPNSLEFIDTYAFSHCDNLQSIEIPGSVSEIASRAFRYCPNLSEVRYECSEPVTASKDVFDDITYETATLKIADGTLAKIQSTEPWMYFTHIVENSVLDIEGITADSNNPEPIEVYDINGIKIADSIDNLMPGIYIIRKGNYVTKRVITRN